MGILEEGKEKALRTGEEMSHVRIIYVLSMGFQYWSLGEGREGKGGGGLPTGGAGYIATMHVPKKGFQYGQLGFSVWAIRGRGGMGEKAVLFPQKGGGSGFTR